MTNLEQLSLADVLARQALDTPLCPKCGGKLRLRDGGANLRGACTSCSLTVLIPKRS